MTSARMKAPSPPDGSLLVRPMTAEDADAVATLSGQLGYPMTPSRIQKRYKMIIHNPDNGLFVAERDGIILGWVHVLGVHYLESPRSFAEIGGLVVDAEFRRQQVGRLLMERAEAWAREQGYQEVRLRSGLHRTEAHQFYQAVGYTLTKTGHTFQKALDAPPFPSTVIAPSRSG